MAALYEMCFKQGVYHPLEWLYRGVPSILWTLVLAFPQSLCLLPNGRHRLSVQHSNITVRDRAKEVEARSSFGSMCLEPLHCNNEEMEDVLDLSSYFNLERERLIFWQGP